METNPSEPQSETIFFKQIELFDKPFIEFLNEKFQISEDMEVQIIPGERF
jgi:hypothetical protein